MRVILLATLAMAAGFPAVPAALAEEPAPAAEQAAPAQPAAEADATVKIKIAAADPAKAEEKTALRLPSGFKEKKRGKFTLYCRKEDVMGSRFPTEKCYDEQGIRDYIMDQMENQKQVDQMRRICGNLEACGAGN